LRQELSGRTGGEEEDMYVITGATGKTGGAATEKLLASGEKVRVVGRDAKRLERFAQKGAEAFVADVTDAGALEKAFSGAKAVYAMIPPNNSAPDVRAYQERVTDALAAAIKNSGVGHVVALSSFGADKPDRVGPVVGLYHFEKKLEAIAGLNALFLRASYFMENILPQVGVIQSFGMVAGPLRPDLSVPMIATRDIGAVAADILLKLDFVGKQARELLGARDVTYSELTKIIGTGIGNPGLAYTQLTATQLKPALTQMGMSSNMADLLLEMSDALNSGYMKPRETRSPRNTTPTTIETFISDTFVPAYRGKAAGA
jgi:uncharacterized protein YbjT (DUF2867 family)